LIFKISKKNNKVSKIGKVNINFIDSIFINFRLYQRFRRLIFYNFIQLSENLFFVNFSNKIGLIRNNKFHEISDFKNNFKILNNAICFDMDNNLIFGEYLSNNKRKKDIHIYKYNFTSNTVSIKFRFSNGKIRHIHGVYKDPFTSYFYVLTGDVGNECGIYYTTDNFKTLLNIGFGNETWRAVSLVFTKKYIYYGMDAEFVSNKIYRIDKKTSKRKSLGKISGPVYYSTLFINNPIFVVTAELCPSQKDNNVNILIVLDDKIIQIQSFEKDFIKIPFIKGFLTKLFLPGLFHIYSENNKNIYFSGYALKNADNKVFMLKN